jgi:transcription-repair coupling factor (superfamily II helicase)
VPEVRLLPGREFPMDDAARAKFRTRWRELLEGDPTKSRIYKDMGNGVATAGIEYYLPLFFDDTATVFDYLGTAPPWCCTATWKARCSSSGKTRASAIGWRRATRRARPCRPRRCFWTPSSSTPGQAARAAGLRPGADGTAAVAEPGPPASASTYQKLPELTVVRGAEEPLAAPASPPARHPRRVRWCWPKAMAGAKACWTFCAPAAQPAGLRFAGRVSGQRRTLGIATAALAQGFAWLEAGHRLRHRNRAVCHKAPPRAGAKSRSRSAMSRR